MKQLIIFIITVILSSCGELSNREMLEILNNNESTPAIYKNLIILDNNTGYWIGNTSQYNRGGHWTKIETPNDMSNAHNLTPPSLRDITPNSKLLDQHGKSVYIHNRRGCRGCNYCYQQFQEFKLAKYRIIKGEVGTEDNLRIATSLTDMGEEYRLISEETDLFKATENQIFVKVAEYKFTKIISASHENKNFITAEVEYHLDYTPFGEALGYKDTPTSTATFQIKKSNDGWLCDLIYEYVE